MYPGLCRGLPSSSWEGWGGSNLLSSFCSISSTCSIGFTPYPLASPQPNPTLIFQGIEVVDCHTLSSTQTSDIRTHLQLLSPTTRLLLPAPKRDSKWPTTQTQSLTLSAYCCSRKQQSVQTCLSYATYSLKEQSSPTSLPTLFTPFCTYVFSTPTSNSSQRYCKPPLMWTSQ